MPRYVILEHDHPKLHWDFMLEAGEVLRTWRLSARPEAGREVAAEPVADHRPFYLDYEGPVSGDRGMVKRWDWGTFVWRSDQPASITVDLEGQRLHGTIQLQQRESGNWTLTFAPA